MGKKKQAKKAERAGAGEAPKGAMPKRVAGVKLPKDVRRVGDTLLATATSPAGLEMIATGLKIAATVATVAAAGRMAAQTAAAPEGGKPAMPSADRKPEDIGAALGIMAQEMMGRMFGKASGKLD